MTLNPRAQQLLDLVVARSGRDAVAFVLSELDSGSAPTTLVTEMLAPVQSEVGERWHRRIMTVTDEHAATAVVGNALAALAVMAPVPPRFDRGTMALVCAEGDWHTLPARMFGELARWEGWDVTFLGGSLPPADLTRWLVSGRPDVMAISCSVPVYLPGVLRLANAARDAGVACLVGGRGLGPDSARADALGLRWAASPATMAASLLDAPPVVSPKDLKERFAEAEALQALVDDLVGAALGRLIERVPAIGNYNHEQLARTRLDYRLIIEFLIASVFSDDGRIFAEFLAWLQTLLTSIGLPPAVLAASLAALADVLPVDFPKMQVMWAATVAPLKPVPSAMAADPALIG